MNGLSDQLVRGVGIVNEYITRRSVMKKLFAVVMSVGIVLSMSAISFAGGGMATVPYLNSISDSSQTISSVVHVTNSSSVEVEMIVKTYDKDGGEALRSELSTSWCSVDESKSDSTTMVISLGAKEMCEINLPAGTTTLHRSAIITWSSSAAVENALTALAWRKVQYNGYGPTFMPIPVNGGESF